MTDAFSVQTEPAVSVRPERATVSQRVGRAASFVLRYAVESEGSTLRPIGEAGLDPDRELSVLDAGEQPVVRGVVLRQRAHVEHGPVRSWVEVAGADLSIKMARETRRDRHVGTVQDILNGIVGGYFERKEVAALSHRHVDKENELIQATDDLAFVREVAGRYGHLFDVRFGTREAARVWQPSTQGEPAATIRINEPEPNVDAVELAWDVDRPTTIDARQVSLLDKAVWGAAAESPTPGGPSTRQTLATAATTRTTVGAWPAHTSEQLDQHRQAALRAEGWFVSLSCVTTTMRLGAVVHAGDVIEVSGLGRHDGRYVAWEVEHVLDPVTHTMTLQLVADGWESGALPI